MLSWSALLLSTVCLSTHRHACCCTMKFGVTTKMLAKGMLNLYRILECAGQAVRAEWTVIIPRAQARWATCCALSCTRKVVSSLRDRTSSQICCRTIESQAVDWLAFVLPRRLFKSRPSALCSHTAGLTMLWSAGAAGCRVAERDRLRGCVAERAAGCCALSNCR